MILAQAELKRNQIRSTNSYNWKGKKRVVQAGDKVLVLLPTDHNKFVMQRKSPFEIKVCKGGNNYQGKTNRKKRHFASIRQNNILRGIARDDCDAWATEFSRGLGRKPG